MWFKLHCKRCSICKSGGDLGDVHQVDYIVETTKK